MYKCSCSERPMEILESHPEVKDNEAWQVLVFGCGNKKCPNYHKPAYREKINLVDRKTTISEEITE